MGWVSSIVKTLGAGRKPLTGFSDGSVLNTGCWQEATDGVLGGSVL